MNNHHELMTDTLHFQCQDCGEVAAGNPRTCPSCGDSVMRPVETSEPGAKNHEIRTNDFDVDQALSRLNTPEQATEEDPEPEDSTIDELDNTSSQDENDLLGRLKSLFWK